MELEDLVIVLWKGALCDAQNRTAYGHTINDVHSVG